MFKIFFALFIEYILLFTFPKSSFAIQFDDPSLWHDAKVSEFLENSKILDIKPMKDALNEMGKITEFDGKVYLITLENNIKAVFKVLPPHDQGDAEAEVAAYKASIKLGFPYVPPTILRTVNNMKGSMQLYVNTPIDLLKKDEYTNYLSKFDSEDLANLRMFYFIFGQWDSGAHNLLAYKHNNRIYPIAIDNSGIRNHQYISHYGELPYVRILYSDKLATDDWGKPFPFNKFIIIQNPDYKKLQKVFNEKVPEIFYKNFNSYNEPLKLIIYNNSIWRQYHAFDSKFIRAWTGKCPSKTIGSIKLLNRNELKNIFILSKKSDFFTKAYIDNILKRRDMVLDYCATNLHKD